MKNKVKYFSYIISFMLGIILFSTTAYASTNVTIKKLKIKVNEKNVQTVAGCMIDGEAYIKFVDIADIMGYYLGYDKDRKEYVISTGYNENLPQAKREKNKDYGTTYNDIKVKKMNLDIHYKELWKIDGCSINKKAYVKLEDLAEATKYNVQYDKEKKVYSLTKQIKEDISYKNEERKETDGYKTVSEMTKKGDTIPTDHGDYLIEVGKTEKIKEEAALPEWQKEWGEYPKVEFPTDTTAQRAIGKVGEKAYDFVQKVNLYELERMIRTIYKYAKENSLLWENRDPSTNIPDFSIKIEYTDDMAFATFYPWRDSEIRNVVLSTGGNSEFRIYAIDVYNKGKFMETQYFFE